MLLRPDEIIILARRAIDMCLEEMRDHVEQFYNMSLEEREEYLQYIHNEEGTLYEPGTVPIFLLIVRLEDYISIIEENYVSLISRTDRLFILRVSTYRNNPYIRYIGHLEYELNEKIWRLKRAHKLPPFHKKKGPVQSFFDFVKKLINEKIWGLRSPPDLDPWDEALNVSVPVEPFFDFVKNLILDEKKFVK